jgi:hypothetical protein
MFEGFVFGPEDGYSCLLKMFESLKPQVVGFPRFESQNNKPTGSSGFDNSGAALGRPPKPKSRRRPNVIRFFNCLHFSMTPCRLFVARARRVEAEPCFASAHQLLVGWRQSEQSVVSVLDRVFLSTVWFSFLSRIFVVIQDMFVAASCCIG